MKTEYEEELDQRATALSARKAQQLDVDPDDAFYGIDWNEETSNDNYFIRLINAKVIKPADITKRKARERTKAQTAARLYSLLGKVPDRPLDFVEQMFAKQQIEIDWKGMISGGQTLNDLKRVMRIKAVELELPYERWEVDDATEQCYRSARADCPAILASELAQRQHFDWNDFAQTYFKENDTLSYTIIAAVLQKFVHQVRRKLVGKKVTFHLMPVLHGRQGGGKTFLLESMVAPLKRAVAFSDFDQITDARNIDLWSSLVIVLDEMARAAKADVETIKHVISAETLDRREMRSNGTTPVANRATLIGASNHRLDELLRDETGNRRFVELIFNDKAPHSAIKRFDFAAMWRSIQPDDPDPLAAFRDDLAKAQAGYAVKGPVQYWLDSGKADAVFRDCDGYATTHDLYQDFLLHRSSVTAGIDYQARTQQVFASELRRVVEQDETYQITKVHRRDGNRWFCAKPRPLTILKGGRK